ncbi:dTDP-4-dehydrorhamnose 3,5-epimerase [Candidatus Uhrbacteria bacterium CG_4_10_14_0_8_um_filter_58_22]|uniref:dTDP-4-dehydrorhamnose 3,5-epimerase n=1 Tax=Candidatus Uhrbacteria bacterium CG_4_10_14_0_8_um_filter_58_22 TaxID=1975029 RepID=A0A2M7QAC1_9BACT|nr:MAG: dTDP-4-dehydrorhamnose 3,5-epimerase [Parcubacteria group bacterium CG1_02_58_44]PIY62167.1 MAG: dTDP-4-dehydrorhamnose 3,5-epimerase [Candidatus Uhrbacteria bacterium CG_4_10_14_0_8_um_filter_58_22]
MKAIETGIAGLLVVEPQVFGDERGWFMEAHSRPKFDALGIESDVVQINHSFSVRGVLRGLHFQTPPNDQTKLVRCLRGRLYDVAVDIRVGSPTFGRWFGLELSAENRKMLFVPSGFAHGFYSVDDSELMYLCGRSGYSKETEGGLRFDAEDLGIAWPLDGEPTINDRDRNFPTLAELQSPFVWQEEKVKEMAL